jgi:DNA sulfur modification protein DndC
MSSLWDGDMTGKTMQQKRQISLFDEQRLTLEGALELSLSSLREYGQRYRHWVSAYSGGKDSTATVTFTAWAILNNLVPQPESWTILYSDTRLEIVPLQRTAMSLLSRLYQDAFQTKVVMAPLDDRFFVYMLGYGVPPPSNRFRWCTEQMKIEPMKTEVEQMACDLGFGQMVYDEKQKKFVYEGFGEKFLMLTGVRLGESQVRDQRIALSCSRDSGECGQGWMQVQPPKSVADTLAPLLHWRLCNVYDWIYFEESRHGYDVSDIALIYGDGEIRTGCIGCPLVSRDVALERLVKKPGWKHLQPLLELKPLYRELKKAKSRKRKLEPERRKDGSFGVEANLKQTSFKIDISADWQQIREDLKKAPRQKKQRDNSQWMGPLTMEARAYGLERVLDIQQRAGVDLINAEEEARIRELWRLDAWPRRWSAEDISAVIPIDAKRVIASGEIVTQALLVR